MNILTKNYLRRKIAIVRSWRSYTAEKKVARKYTFPIFKPAELNLEKNNFNETRAFILGSGSTINNMSQKNLNEIRKNFSIGINHWFAHDFEPDFLMIESFREKDRLSPIYEWRKKNLFSWARNSRSRILIKDYAEDYFFWEDWFRLPKEKSYFIPKMPLHANSRFDLIKKCRWYGSSSFIAQNLWFSRASVSLAISICVSLGFRKIVLCGIDMKDSRYFWDFDDYLKHPLVDRPPSISPDPAKLHSTICPAKSIITADEVVYAFAELLFRRCNLELNVASKASLLYPRIPVYEFD